MVPPIARESAMLLFVICWFFLFPLLGTGILTLAEKGQGRVARRRCRRFSTLNPRARKLRARAIRLSSVKEKAKKPSVVSRKGWRRTREFKALTLLSRQAQSLLDEIERSQEESTKALASILRKAEKAEAHLSSEGKGWSKGRAEARRRCRRNKKARKVSLLKRGTVLVGFRAPKKVVFRPSKRTSKTMPREFSRAWYQVSLRARQPQRHQISETLSDSCLSWAEIRKSIEKSERILGQAYLAPRELGSFSSPGYVWEMGNNKSTTFANSILRETTFPEVTYVN
jgi:hypothetical protein